MQELTFDQLPKAVSQLFDKLENIENLLKQQSGDSAPEVDDLLTVEQAAEFLSLSKPTVYGLISKGEIPVMKRSKRCYFSKLELIAYLKQGRKKSNAEIEAAAEQRLKAKVQ
jgi:excisionase family DNA binding protein